MELALFLLVVKHCILDLALQPLSYPEGKNKFNYFGLYAHLQHYIPHGLGTVFVLLFFVDPCTALICGLIDYILHWHIDFSKTHTRAYFGWTNKNRQFWLLNALDQLLHFSTYYLIIFWLV
jgi:hypothetical protein